MKLGVKSSHFLEMLLNLVLRLARSLYGYTAFLDRELAMVCLRRDQLAAFESQKNELPRFDLSNEGSHSWGLMSLGRKL